MRRLFSIIILISVILPVLSPIVAYAQGEAPLRDTPECREIKQAYNVTNLSELNDKQAEVRNAYASINQGLLKENIAIAYDAFTLADSLQTSDPQNYTENQQYQDAFNKGVSSIGTFKDIYFGLPLNIKKLVSEGYADGDDSSIFADLETQTDGWFSNPDKPASFLKERTLAVVSHLNNKSETFGGDAELFAICEKQQVENPTPEQAAEIERLQNQHAATVDNQEREAAARDEAQARARSQITAQENLRQCVGWTGPDLPACLRDAISWIMWLFSWVFSWLVYFAAGLFNKAVQVSIVDFKSLTDGLLLSTLWATVRDIANMMLIFFLLYIAGSIILQVTNFDSSKKAVVTLIIVALLVNFSGVITRVVIDISNITALVFYDRFSSTEGDIDIAGKFVMESRMDTLVSATPERPGGNNDIGSQIFAILVKGIMTCILSIITAFMLLMSAGFFIVRTVAFIVLILISPLAFVGYAIPYLKSKVYEPWKKELIGQATFAPVFMGLFYFTVKLTEGVNNLSINSLDSVTGAAIIYGILMMMMFNCLLIARKSATGMASSTLKGLGLTGLNAAGAYLGWRGSTLGGSWAQKRLDAGKGVFGSNSRLDKWAAKQMATRTWNPMNAVKAADKKIDEIKGGKGPGFNNRSYVQRQKDSKEKAKTKADDHKTRLKAIEKESNAAEAAKYIATIADKNEKTAFYESLSTADRAKYEVEAGKAGDTSTKTALAELRQGLKEEDRIATGKAYGNKLSTKESEASLSDLLLKAGITETKDNEGKRVTTTPRTRTTPLTTSDQDLVKATSGNALENLAYSDADWLTKILETDAITKHFNNEQLQSLYRVKDIVGNTLWDKVQDNIMRNGTNQKGKDWVQKKGNIPWIAAGNGATITANIENQNPTNILGSTNWKNLRNYLRNLGFKADDMVTIIKKDGTTTAGTFKKVKPNGMIEIDLASMGLKEIDPAQIKTVTK